jgi:hypothetical protein
MLSSGLAGFFTALTGLFGLAFYAALLFAVWKFYELLRNLTAHVAEIRRLLENSAPDKLKS